MCTPLGRGVGDKMLVENLLWELAAKFGTTLIFDFWLKVVLCSKI